MKAIGYLRVSTLEQVRGFGLAAQESAIRSYSRTHGLRLTAVYRDEGLSGGKAADDRPGLASALDTITADVVLVVAKLDRVARELTVQEAVLAHVWRAGGQVHAADVGPILQDDPDDPMRTAMRQMMGVFAQLERGMIRARMRAGKREKQLRGGYVGGAPGFGWRARGKTLVPVEAEQQAIVFMRRLQAEGASYRTICKVLEDAQVAPRRGGRWQPAVVRDILMRASGSLA